MPREVRMRCVFAILIGSAIVSVTAAQPPPPRDLSDFIRLYDTDRSGVSRFYSLPWSETRLDRRDGAHRPRHKRPDGSTLGTPSHTGSRIDILPGNQSRSDQVHPALYRARLPELDP